MNWEDIIHVLGGVSVFSIAIGYIGRVAVKSFFDARIASYKSELECAAIEYRARLEMEALKGRVTFERLHSDRADAIKAIYERMVSLESLLRCVFRDAFDESASVELQGNVDDLIAACEDCVKLYSVNRLYFDESVCGLVDGFLAEVKDIIEDIHQFNIDPGSPSLKLDKWLPKERFKMWKHAMSTYEKELLVIKKALEIEFRKLVGVAT